MIQRKKQIEKLFEDLQVLKRKMIAGASSHMERTHITASQWLVLQYLRKNDRVTIKEIAQTLSMTSSAATQLVESLVHKGYVDRKTNSDDKRARSLSLSDRSKKRMEMHRRKRIQDMQHVFDVLTDEEFKSYCYLLNKITESLVAGEKQ